MIGIFGNPVAINLLTDGSNNITSIDRLIGKCVNFLYGLLVWKIEFFVQLMISRNILSCFVCRRFSDDAADLCQ